MTDHINRRHFIGATVAFAAALATGANTASAANRKLSRVIIDNDFSGDPDGLFQLAHHVLCPSLDIPLIIGSHLPAQFGSGHDAADAASKARELLKTMRLDDTRHIIAGAESPIKARSSWQPSAASAAIVREAMRSDTDLPLIYAAGAGLTELALAWLQEPRIGRRIRLIWIGGSEHPESIYPPLGQKEVEFNFMIDPVAAKIIFNESDIEIWQVPRDVYRQMLFSNAELDDLAERESLMKYLKGQIQEAIEKLAKIPGLPPITETETYVLGDSPLVTLTALVPPFQPDPSSCRYVLKPAPTLLDDGTYKANASGRPMRVYTYIDAELTFRDMLVKFKRAAASRPAA
ncbi:nucleoside hydrolase [Duganella sp. FT80W]|uniref:Nucleoside hydrolase n=1 Tax=Duganella guangzhouensis TaxID=2666084 RepID=A0A6I2L533_9BURK|nr:nucleoside hydrolase [Duganella guangzhouensis]MRW93258.1 nucleoside hydrolase [Duganella guangzhouensis]